MGKGNPAENWSQGKLVLRPTADGAGRGLHVDNISEFWVCGRNIWGASAHLVIANTDLVAAISFETSNDGVNGVPVTFIDQNGTSYTSYPVSSGVAVNQMFIFRDLFEGNLRVNWNWTSGSNENNLLTLTGMAKGH